MFNCLPDDPKITELDDITRSWMFFSWLEDKNEHSILLRNQGCLIGSFWNPKAAQEILGVGDSNKVTVSDEDFEKSFKFVIDERVKSEEDKRRKNQNKRKKKKTRIVLKKDNI